jgi:hypothetical protein
VFFVCKPLDARHSAAPWFFFHIKSLPIERLFVIIQYIRTLTT